MQQKSLRALIIEKLADGRLPHDSIPRVWGGPGNNETCVACGLIVGKHQFVMESDGDGMQPIQFHLTCFRLWDTERAAPGASVGFVPYLSQHFGTAIEGDASRSRGQP